MTTTDTPPRWRITKYSSALLVNEGEICNEIYCASHDEADCLVDVLNELTCRAEKAEAEVERLRDLLNRALNEIEKTPFHTPKLTAFTAHKLAERYREKMTNTSTKPIESQEDDK